MESQKAYPQNFSFEFFPPKSPDGAIKLRKIRHELAKLKPNFFSVTFGAGGSTQEGSYSTIIEIHEEGFEAAPHLSCVGSTRESISNILGRYRIKGIKRIVALRGDIPSGMRDAGEFRHANELVAYIREITGENFHIEVAAYPEVHPQAASARTEINNFKRKIDAGANSAITQYFYNADAYFHFVNECEKLKIKPPDFPRNYANH